MIDQYTLMELQGKHAFDAISLARKAKVHHIVVEAILNGIAVHRQQAEKVLLALSTMTGKRYTLNNVAVKLLPDAEERTGVIS